MRLSPVLEGLQTYPFVQLAQTKARLIAEGVELVYQELRAVLDDAGYTAGEVGPGPGGGASTRLVGTDGDLTAVFSSTVGSSGGAKIGPVIGLDVYGPCTDVPEDERDAWLRRDEPTPDLLRR